MAKVKSENSSRSSKKIRPALTVENREKQLIALAVDCAEEQLRNGTASSQVITHFLKLGSTRAEIELEKLKNENELIKAKAKHIDNMESISEMYEKAIAAMRNYAGYGDSNED